MSDWYQIENSDLTLQVTTKGAELKRLFSKLWNRELLWQDQDKLWNRTSPVLFPIVGKLHQDSYVLNGKKYEMMQHGFARDLEFECTAYEGERLEFLLRDSELTATFFPFKFSLYLEYKISDRKLTTKYTVINNDVEEMPFSIGAHPGFSIQHFKQSYVQFSHFEKEYYKLNASYVDFTRAHPLSSSKLELTPDMFKDDAWIFKDLQSKYVDLIDIKRLEMLRMHLDKTPYFGLWSKDPQKFLCLEPWWGVADVHQRSADFKDKIGTMILKPQERKSFQFSLELFNLEKSIE